MDESIAAMTVTKIEPGRPTGVAVGKPRAREIGLQTSHAVPPVDFRNFPLPIFDILGLQRCVSAVKLRKPAHGIVDDLIPVFIITPDTDPSTNADRGYAHRFRPLHHGGCIGKRLVHESRSLSALMGNMGVGVDDQRIAERCAGFRCTENRVTHGLRPVRPGQ